MSAQTLFLTDEELRQLTGYQRNADRCCWLKRNGFVFEVAATGRPVVLRSHLEARLSGKPEQRANEWTPNLAVMKKVA